MPPEPETKLQSKINIAIDGFSSCGKSTLAKALARELHYRYLDTGAMYRAVGYFALKKEWINHDGSIDAPNLIHALQGMQVGFAIDPQTGGSQVSLAGEVVEPFIRNLQIATLASKVSQIRQVRDYMQILQKQMAKEKGVVMDGRDIGTVVMPQAELKIFMTADPQVRAQRRKKELEVQGKNLDLKTVLEQQMARDFEDENRQEDPLRKAEDARILDNTHLNAEQQLRLALDWVNQARLNAIAQA
jgi:cytidylate kinase